MGFFDIFNQSKTRKINYIRILIHLSKIDGKVDAEEIQLISYVSKHLNLSDEDFREAQSMGDIPLVFPTKESQKIELINDLVMLMLSDSKIDILEYVFCLQTALRFDLDPTIIDDTIKNIVETSGILDHLDKDQIWSTYMISKVAVAKYLK